jgi:hypothetical protein
MPREIDTPKSITKIIDELETIREKLLAVQRSLELHERPASTKTPKSPKTLQR